MKKTRSATRSSRHSSRALAECTGWITRAATEHGAALPEHVAARLGLTRRRALNLLRKLEAAQWLHNAGTARAPRWQPGALRQVVQRYSLAGLNEDQPWRADFAPFFTLRPELAQLLQYAFSELLNNAVDHSGGASVTVSLRQTALHLQLLVSDDGVGLFNRYAEQAGLVEPLDAMFELSKGGLSTQPQRHRGQGLYYLARLADCLQLQANSAGFRRLNDDDELHSGCWSALGLGGSAGSARSAASSGTTVYLALALDTARTLPQVLGSAALSSGGYAFERTTVPLSLLGSNGLVSRAQARRAAARLAQFRHAELDFSGVALVGHSFADELFRVCREEQPALQFGLRGLSPAVEQMLRGYAAVASAAA